MASIITFEAIVDTRFGAEGPQDCERLVGRYRAAFAATGLALDAAPIRMLRFEGEPCVQWRSRLSPYLGKRGQRQLAMIAANGVKACPYKFLRAPARPSD